MTLIYFITGNPGVLSYYHSFLCGLADELRDDAEEYLICGSSLAGFDTASSASGDDEAQRSAAEDEEETDDDEEEEGTFDWEREWESNSDCGKNRARTGRSVQNEQDEKKGQTRRTTTTRTRTRRRYFDLNQQIRFVERKLRKCVQQWQQYHCGVRCKKTKNIDISKSTNASRPRPKVIIVGHSVGAYIAMEVLRRHRERLQLREYLSEDDDGGGDDGVRVKGMIDMDITGEVLLFPTIVDIAKSSAGATLTVRSALAFVFFYSLYPQWRVPTVANSIQIKSFLSICFFLGDFSYISSDSSVSFLFFPSSRARS